MLDFEKYKNLCGVYEIGVSETEFSGLPRAISLVFRLSDAIVDSIDGAPTYEYFHHYRTVNAAIDRAEYLICADIMREGYNALPVAASQTVGGNATMKGLFSHKIAAARADLGCIGRNALFIAYGIGPRVRLGTVFTDMPLETKTVEAKPCMGCGKCARACGAQAIYDRNFDPENPEADLIDRKACSDYMKREFQHIGRGAVCGVCMKVCEMK